MTAWLRTITLFLLIATIPAMNTVAENKWESRIKKFEAADVKNPPAPGGIVFVGSSSMVFWKTDKAFPEHNIINRGFGGSETSASLEYADRIIINYKPRLVAIFAGDNDIGRG